MCQYGWLDIKLLMTDIPAEASKYFKTPLHVSIVYDRDDY